MLYPQNGDRIVALDYVTSFHPVCRFPGLAMEAILSNSTRKLLWSEINKMLFAGLKNKFIASFITIFGAL